MHKENSPALELSQSSAMPHMDMMRGVAAVAVLVNHVRGLFFVEISSVPAPSLLLRVVYLLTGFAHQAVVVFFVLSGFFIGVSVLGSYRRGTWSWERYLIRRFSRLMLVLVPALLLTAVLDLAGLHAFGANNIYGGKLDAPFVDFADARDTLGASTFIGNLAFLQNFFVGTYGTNSPLWSLSYEFWSYMLFPLAVTSLARRSSMASRFAAVLIGANIVRFGGATFVQYFGLWIIGVLVALAWHRISTKRTPPRVRNVTMLVAGAVFTTTLVAARISHASRPLRDYGAAVATAILLLALLSNGPRKSELGTQGYATLATRLAGFSYTLYLVHFPMVALLNARIIGVARWQPTPLGLLVAATICTAVLAISYGIATLTERHTEPFRAAIERALRLLRSKRNIVDAPREGS